MSRGCVIIVLFPAVATTGVATFPFSTRLIAAHPIEALYRCRRVHGNTKDSFRVGTGFVDALFRFISRCNTLYW